MRVCAVKDDSKSKSIYSLVFYGILWHYGISILGLDELTRCPRFPRMRVFLRDGTFLLKAWKPGKCHVNQDEAITLDFEKCQQVWWMLQVQKDPEIVASHYPQWRIRKDSGCGKSGTVHSPPKLWAGAGWERGPIMGEGTAFLGNLWQHKNRKIQEKKGKRWTEHGTKCRKSRRSLPGLKSGVSKAAFLLGSLGRDLFPAFSSCILAPGPPLSSKPAVVAWSFTGNSTDTDLPSASLFHLQGFWWLHWNPPK